MTGPADERVTVGLVRGLHGLRGALRVEVLTDHPERFLPGAVLYADADDQPLTVAWVGATGPGLLLRFAELTTRAAAEPLRDCYLEAAADRPLPEGSYYWHEVVGLEVFTSSGELLGTVQDVFRAGEGEVYVVRGGPLGEVLVPAVRDVIMSLDPVAGRIVVDPVALALPEKPPRRRRRHERLLGEATASAAEVPGPAADPDEAPDPAAAPDEASPSAVEAPGPTADASEAPDPAADESPA